MEEEMTCFNSTEYSYGPATDDLENLCGGIWGQRNIYWGYDDGKFPTFVCAECGEVFPEVYICGPDGFALRDHTGNELTSTFHHCNKTGITSYSWEYLEVR